MRRTHLKLGIASFELIKGLAMMTVVIGHMVSYYNVEQLALFYLPGIFVTIIGKGALVVFFMICGLRFKPKPVKTVLKKSFKEAIIPYLYVMVIITLLYPIRHRIEYGGWWYRTFLETMRWTVAFLLGIAEHGTVIHGFRLQWCSATWFLLAMFLSNNLLNLILQNQNVKIQIALVALCAAFGYGLSLLGFEYFCIPQSLIAVVFCYLGYMIQKYNLLDRLVSWPAFTALALVSLCYIIWGDFNLAHLEFNNFLLDYVGVACLGLLLLILSLYFSKFECAVTEWIENVGVYTYWIMCIHSVEMAAFPWYRFNKLAPESYQPLMFLLELALKAVIIGTFCMLLKKYTMFKLKRKRKALAGTK